MEHPNLIQIYDLFDDQEAFYVVMEIAQGGMLYEHVAGCGRYSEESARKVMRRLFSVLEYIHCFELVHRDLKVRGLRGVIVEIGFWE
uniref:Protein kinase domain-containing protein n=1 Tax=Arcella intermedia TaxID=1963864 RepID=A0A6B2LPJ4_9EUKA